MIKKEYNSSKEIVRKYNLIQFSKNTDLVFEKIDSIEEIIEVYREDTFIKYITKSEIVIKNEKWDDVVTIMDEDNNKAKEVYLVRDFLNYSYKGVVKIQEHLNEIDKLIEWGEKLGEWEYRIPKIKKHLKQIKGVAKWKQK